MVIEEASGLVIVCVGSEGEWVDQGEGHRRSFAGAGVRRFREAERSVALFRA